MMCQLEDCWFGGGRLNGGRLEVVDLEVVILEVADSANVGLLLSMGCAVAWCACRYVAGLGRSVACCGMAWLGRVVLLHDALGLASHSVACLGIVSCVVMWLGLVVLS